MKPPLTLCLIVLIISWFSVIGVVDVIKADTSVSGIISSNTTWTKTNSPYNLEGNVLIDFGVTLTIEPGVTANLGSYYIMVNGTFFAQGSNTDPIRVNGGSLIFTQFSTGWNDQNNSGCTIENAALSLTELKANTALKLKNDTISAQITVDSTTTISNSRITGDVSGGILLNNSIFGNVNSQTILNNTITGTTSGSLVSNNTITGNVGGSMISNNTINGEVSAQGNSIISQNTISSSGTAVGVSSLFFMSGGQPTIENNIIENSTVGISVDILVRAWVGANIPLIQNNLIRRNEIGIQYTLSRQEPYPIAPTIIQNNTIVQNEIGVKFNSAEDYQFQYNNLHGNSNYSLYLSTTRDLNATDNWWGTTDSQLIGQSIYDYYDDFTLGRVNYIPFLNAPAIPEFPSLLLPMLLLVASTLGIVFFKKQRMFVN